MSATSNRLLLVSQRPLDYGGGGSVRWSFFRHALPGLGWEVDAVTARANPTANEASTDPRAARLAAARARVMGVAGKLLAAPAHVAGVQPEALAPNGIWSVTGRRPVRRAMAAVQPDVVLATCPPPSALLAAAAVVGPAGPPLVAEFRDLWAGNPYFDAGGSALARIEGRALARCAAVVTVTERCRERLLDLHPELHERVHLLPNGFDPMLLTLRAPPEPRQAVATLLHAGTLYGDRTAVALMRALRRPELRGKARLVLLGPADPASLREAMDETAVESSVPWRDAIERLHGADIAVVINSPGTGGDMALPSKLFEALALARPVLALTPEGSETERLLRELGQDAGCAPPDDEQAIAAALERLLAAPPAPVPPDQLEPWSRAVVARRMAALLSELAASAPRAPAPSRA